MPDCYLDFHLLKIGLKLSSLHIVSGGTVFNPSAFSEKKLLLIYLLDGNIGRQKEALYALQHLMHRLEHPNSELKIFYYSIFGRFRLSNGQFGL
jgi:hypothetical protein